MLTTADLPALATLTEMFCTDRIFTKYTGFQMSETEVFPALTTTVRMFLTVNLTTLGTLSDVFEAVWLAVCRTDFEVVIADWLLTDRTECRIRLCDVFLAGHALEHVAPTSRFAIDGTVDAVISAERPVTGDTVFMILLTHWLATEFALNN